MCSALMSLCCVFFPLLEFCDENDLFHASSMCRTYFLVHFIDSSTQFVSILRPMPERRAVAVPRPAAPSALHSRCRNALIFVETIKKYVKNDALRFKFDTVAVLHGHLQSSFEYPPLIALHKLPKTLTRINPNIICPISVYTF